MELLRDLVYEHKVIKMYNRMAKLEEAIDRAVELRNTIITEGPLDDHNGAMEAEFDEMSKRLNAARRGLGLANRLRDPDQRKENKSRVMSNMNKIRQLLKRVMQSLGYGDRQLELNRDYRG